MSKRFFGTAAILGALAVALGAFGAHKLREMLPADGLNVFDTGVRYHFYHTLALLIVALLADRYPRKAFTRAGNCFIAGIILFSGSLYALTIIRIADAPALSKYIGIVTPIGGL